MHDELAELVRDAAAEPPDTPDFAALAVRGRRERLLIRAATGIVGVAAMVLGGVLLWPSPQGTTPVVGDDASVPADLEDEGVTLPAGWQWVDVGSARFGVPGGWDVVSTVEKNAAHCSLFYSSPPMVLTGPPPEPISCPAPDYTNPGPGVRATTATTAPEPPDGADTETVIVNGWPAVHWTETATSHVNGEAVERRFAVYWIDDLYLYVKVRTDTAPGLAQQIISTLTPAANGAAKTDDEPSQDDQWLDDEQRQAWDDEHGRATWVVGYFLPEDYDYSSFDEGLLVRRWQRVSDEDLALERSELLAQALAALPGPAPAGLGHGWQRQPHMPDRELELSSAHLEGDEVVLDFSALAANAAGTTAAMVMGMQFDAIVRHYYPEATSICVLVRGEPSSWLHDMLTCPSRA